MRAIALAFTVSLLAVSSAYAQCSWGNQDTVADVAKPTVTAEAPIQTPVPATKSGS